MAVAAYTLKEAQALVDDSVRRSKDRHHMWRNLEVMFRTGQTEQALTRASDGQHVLWSETSKIVLDCINYVLPHLSIIIETVAAQDPELAVEPFGGDPDSEIAAKVAEQILRYYWKRLKVTKRVLRAVSQDVVVLGNGFGKVGWSHVEAERDRDTTTLEEELADLLEADRLDAELAERELTDPDELIGMIQLTESVTLEDEPFVEYVSPYDIHVPGNARRMEETPWVAQRLVLPLDEVRDNSAFNKTAIEALTAEYGYDSLGAGRGESSTSGSSGDYGADRDPFAYVEIFEFYDMRSRRLLVFQQHAEHALFDDEMPYSHRHPPFVHARGFDDGGSQFWAFGYLENIASIQHQINDYVLMQADNARRSGHKYLIDSNALTKELREALESDEPDVVVPVNTGAQPMQEIIHAIDRKGLPPDIYAARDDFTVAMREVLGLNDFQAGGMGADRMSATAAAVVDGNATLRASGPRQQIEDATATIGLLILLLCQEFMLERRAFRLSGPQGVAWLDVSYEDIRGEFDVSVEAGSTTAVNPSTRQQRALDMISTLVPVLEAAGYDTDPMWRQLIREVGFDPDLVLRRIEQEAPPEEPLALGAGGVEPTVPQELMGGPPVPAATQGDIAL